MIHENINFASEFSTCMMVRFGKFTRWRMRDISKKKTRYLHINSNSLGDIISCLFGMVLFIYFVTYPAGEKQYAWMEAFSSFT